jgi:hypothetical protein
MGMHLLGQEYKDDKDFRTNTARYIVEPQQQLLAWPNSRLSADELEPELPICEIEDAGRVRPEVHAAVTFRSPPARTSVAEHTMREP